MLIYLDTSALLKLYKNESGSAELQAYIHQQRKPLFLWELQELEFQNALRLNQFHRILTAQEIRKITTWFRSDKQQGIYCSNTLSTPLVFAAALKLSAKHTPKIGARSLDILHVAAALETSAKAFVSFDSRQLDLARRAGLTTQTW